MELENKAHERCYGLVRTYLQQAFGELAEPNEEGPSFAVMVGNGVYVAVNTAGDDAAAVDTFCWVGQGIELTPDVTRFLLEKNAAMRFVRSGVDAEGDIMLQLSLMDDMLTKDALKFVVTSVADIAYEFENELSMRFR